MAANKADIAKQLFSLILGMGMGGAARGGISLSFIPSRSDIESRQLTANADTFAAKNYPTEFSPDAFHNYDVSYLPGPNANYNSLGKAYADTIEAAGRMQTIDEHNKAITRFVRPGMNAKQLRTALNLGLQTEKELPAFWNESESRRPFKVSSSAVSGIRLTPDARIEVRWGNSPKWYTFKEYPNTYKAAEAAQELLKAPSIGRAVYPVVSRGIGVKGDLGKWNFDNYAEGYA